MGEQKERQNIVSKVKVILKVDAAVSKGPENSVTAEHDLIEQWNQVIIKAPKSREDCDERIENLKER